MTSPPSTSRRRPSGSSRRRPRCATTPCSRRPCARDGRAVTCSPTSRATPTPSGRVCAVALTGEPGTMYRVAADARRRDRGRRAAPGCRPGRRHPRVGASASPPCWPRCGPEHADVRVERVPGGPQISVGWVPFMRLRELVFHHVDLDACFRFDRVAPEVVDLFLAEAVDRLRSHADAPSVRLVPHRGREPRHRRWRHPGHGQPGRPAAVARPRTHRRRDDRRTPTHPSLRRLTMTDPAASAGDTADAYTGRGHARWPGRQARAAPA